jgi:hypothetical protein
VQEWYDARNDAEQAAFDTVLEFLCQRQHHEWGRPEYAPFTGKHGGLGELRFDVGKLEHRPIGCFGPGRSVFTVLIGATKKGRQYDPRSALDSALERREAVLGSLGRSHVFDF